MERLNALWQVVSRATSTAASTAATVRDLAQQTRTYTFHVPASATAALTFYLQIEGATVEIRRWQEARVEVTTRLQAPFGWRVMTDQDEAGVYVVAKRRSVVENFAKGITQAHFEVILPALMYATLNLTTCRLVIDEVNTTLTLTPEDQ